MKLKAFKDIEDIESQIEHLIKIKDNLIIEVQNKCTHPNELKYGLDGGSVSDGYGGSDYYKPTKFECGLCGKKDLKYEQT